MEEYIGVYSSVGSPLKVTITRDAATLHAQTTGQSAFPLEATAANKNLDKIILEDKLLSACT